MYDLNGGLPVTTNLYMLLLLPALTDIRGPLSTTGSDTVFIIPSRLPMYWVLGVDDFNKGTPVEFRGAVLLQIFPVP